VTLVARDGTARPAFRLLRRKAIRMRAVRVAATVIALGVVLACSEEEPPEAATGHAPAPAEAEAFTLSSRAAERLTRPLFNVETGMSGSRLMVGGDMAEVDEETLRVRRDITIVDLATGEEQHLEAPTADLPLAVRTIADDGDGGFLVIFVRCANGDSHGREDDACRPGDLVAYRQPAGSQEWEPLPLPDEPGDGTSDVAVRDSAELGSIPDGNGVFALLSSTAIPFDGSVEQTVAVLADERWRTLGTTERAREACATSSHVYLATEGPYGEGGSTLGLQRVAIDGGPITDVEMPETVSTAFDSVGVHLACSASSVHLTSPPAGADGRPVLFTASDDATGWRSVAFASEGGLPYSVVSAPNGIFVKVFGETYEDHLFSGTGELVTTFEDGLGAFYADTADTSRGFLVGPLRDLAQAQQPGEPLGETIAVTVTPVDLTA
jgi:hypothetical protein